MKGIITPHPSLFYNKYVNLSPKINIIFLYKRCAQTLSINKKSHEKSTKTKQCSLLCIIVINPRLMHI